jgi:hypothetical protein
MASQVVRTIGWVVAGDVALILFLFTFGLLLNVIKIPAHGLFMDMFGAHGLLFGFLLPLAVYSLIPTVLIWFIACVVAVLQERRKHRRGG